MGGGSSVRVGDFSVSGSLTPDSKSIGLSFNNKDIGIGYGKNYYSNPSQQTGTISLRYKDMSLRWENDVSGLGGDGNDRFRSNAREIGYKYYFIGTNVFNNNPKDVLGFENDFLKADVTPGARDHVGAVNGYRYAVDHDLNPLTGKWTGKISSNPSFRTDPNNLTEQIGQKSAMSGQGELIMEGQTNDPNWKGWHKIGYTHETEVLTKSIENGVTKYFYKPKTTVDIHYWKNPLTGETSGFKFKDVKK